MRPLTWTLTLLTLMLLACTNNTPSAQIYVDAAQGLDTNPGSQDKPLKTIKTALSQASSSPAKIVVLLAGTYDGASGETWGYTVPDGVTLKANSAGVILAGIQGKSALTLVGKATLNFLTLRGFDLAVLASAGSPTLNGVIFQDNKTALKLSGNAQATLSDVTFSGAGTSLPGDTLAALLLSDTAQATLNNPILKDTYPTYLQGQAKLVLNGGSASGLGSGVVRMSGSASLACQGFSVQGILTAQSLLQLAESTSADLNKCTYTLKSGEGYAYLASLFGSASIRMQEVSVFGKIELELRGTATRAEVIGGFLAVINSSGILTINNSRLNQLVMSGGSATVSGATLSNNDATPIYVGGGQLKLRGSTVSGRVSSSSANMGVLVSNTIGVIPPDLGTATDPGGNNFSASDGPGLEVNAPVQVSAVGNIWKANVQGANASGQYANGVVSGPAGNRTKDHNYYLSPNSSIRF